MNRYDYYTRCVNIDEQEWLTEELYYPEQEEDSGYDPYNSSCSSDYDEDFDGDPFYRSYEDDEEDCVYEWEDEYDEEDEEYEEEEGWIEDWPEEQESPQDESGIKEAANAWAEGR